VVFTTLRFSTGAGQFAAERKLPRYLTMVHVDAAGAEEYQRYSLTCENVDRYPHENPVDGPLLSRAAISLVWLRIQRAAPARTATSPRLFASLGSRARVTGVDAPARTRACQGRPTRRLVKQFHAVDQTILNSCDGAQQHTR